MSWVDVSHWQPAGSVNFAAYDGAIIEVSHELVEDPLWRVHFNAVVAAHRPLGLYHYAGSSPQAEAEMFFGLVGFLAPAQVHGGYWLDAEDGQDNVWVDEFRSAVRLPWCGLYSNLAGFNGPLVAYQHFGINWLAMPTGTVVPEGWTIPDHIMVQTRQDLTLVNGIKVDVDEILTAQPYPGAWAA
jgi:hypothetical protein